MKINYFQLLLIIFFRSCRQSSEMTLARFAENDEKVSEKRPLKRPCMFQNYVNSCINVHAEKNCSWLPKLFYESYDMVNQRNSPWHEIQTTSSLVMFCTSIPVFSSRPSRRWKTALTLTKTNEKTYFPTKVKSQQIFHWLCHSILQPIHTIIVWLPVYRKYIMNTTVTIE